MRIVLEPLSKEHLSVFKRDMQEAFQHGADSANPADTGEEVLPERHIHESLEKRSSAAYQAMLNGQLVGGAIVDVDPDSGKNTLDFLYVKVGTEGKGIGKQIWFALEALYPETKVWQTFTPYFDRRNLHFYINVCGFHAVEFFNTHHEDPKEPVEDGEEYFRFEKIMSTRRKTV